MSQVINKKTNRLKNTTIKKIVNVRAMHRLSEKFGNKKGPAKLPTIDDMLDEFVNEVMDRVGVTGDDVGEAEELEDDDGESDDDEQYNMLDDEDDEDTRLMEVNNSLQEIL